MTILNYEFQQNGENKKDSNTNQENEHKGNIPNQSSAETEENDTQWGYDLYPERRGDRKVGFFQKYFFEGEGNLKKTECEINVLKCIKDNPLINLLLAALKSSGCPFDVQRHISCEWCDGNIKGGFDANLNQIVVCHNNAYSENHVQSVLSHEMIHMFDYCRHEMDFKNIHHTACTEIRAANLMHCSFMGAMAQGQASPFHIKKAHENCVKNMAKASIMATRTVTETEATLAVEKVFPMCYNDLEPVGRRLRRNSDDIKRAYFEGPLFGYSYDK